LTLSGIGFIVLALGGALRRSSMDAKEPVVITRVQPQV